MNPMMPSAGRRAPSEADSSDAPWLVVPLLLTVVLIAGLVVIFGWSIC